VDSLLNIKVKEAGYLFAYLSYEGQSNNYVHFDDFKITHTKSNVLQYNEYYPFGLQTANSWTRESATENNFLYNAGNEHNTLTGLYDLFFRNYDPALGRMHQVDPMADKYSTHTPYKYGLNNPVYWNDPSGADEEAQKRQKWEDEHLRIRQQFEAARLTYGGMFGSVGDDTMFPRAGTLGFDFQSEIWGGHWETQEAGSHYENHPNSLHSENWVQVGESDEIDHPDPEETDQSIRRKLTTSIRRKLTTLIRAN